MSDLDAYKNAYLRQKAARERVEYLLEKRSRELYQANTELRESYEKLTLQQGQLIQQEKLASLGQLAAGVAHEINNPVGFVKANLSAMRNYTNKLVDVFAGYEQLEAVIRSGKADAIDDSLTSLAALKQQAKVNFILDDLEPLAEESLDGVERIQEIVANLKSFARGDDGVQQMIDINSCVDDALRITANELKYRCTIEKNLSPLPKIMGCATHICQVLINLLVNASQAIEGQGVIRIESVCTNGKIIVVVSDTGSGIGEDIITRLFDPFFTTKDVGVGTGLGLSISHGIVKNLGGEIEVKSELGEGSTFRILLPVDAASAW